MHKSLTKFSQIYDKALPEEIKDLLPYFVDKVTFQPDEIKVALFDQPTDKGLLVNNSGSGAPECIEWLPTPITKRTPLILTIHMPIYFIFNKDKRLEIREGKAPYGISTDKRITRRLLKQHMPVVCKPNPITIALKYQEMYKNSAYGSMEKVAQEFGVSRVRVHQMLNLLKLDQRIIKHLLNLTDPKEINYWREYRLRNIATLPKEKQHEKFQRLTNRSKG